MKNLSLCHLRLSCRKLFAARLVFLVSAIKSVGTTPRSKFGIQADEHQFTQMGLGLSRPLGESGLNSLIANASLCGQHGFHAFKLKEAYTSEAGMLACVLNHVF
jgi:hypothetical protein